MLFNRDPFKVRNERGNNSPKDSVRGQKFPCPAWWAGILESLKSGNRESYGAERHVWKEEKL